MFRNTGAPERKPSCHNNSFSCQPSATLRPELCRLCRGMGGVFFGLALKNSMCDHLMRGHHSMGLFMHSCFTILSVTTDDQPLDVGPLCVWALYGSDPCVSTPCEYFREVTLWWCGGVFVVVFCGVVVSLLWCFCVHLERSHMDYLEKMCHTWCFHTERPHTEWSHSPSLHRSQKSDRTSPCNAPADKSTLHSRSVLRSAVL